MFLMIEVPAILYYFLIFVVWLCALVYCIIHFNNQKKLIHSEQNKQKAKQLRLNKPWRDFEKQIADCFSQRWWKFNLWPWEIDDWKDVVVGKNWKIFLIQCKHRFGSWIVQSQQIREFQWSIDFYNKKYNKDAKWIFITTWLTSKRARETADSLWIHLRDTYDWQRKVNTFEW